MLKVSTTLERNTLSKHSALPKKEKIITIVKPVHMKAVELLQRHWQDTLQRVHNMNTTSVEYKYFLSSAVTVEQQSKPKFEQVKVDRRNISLACCLNAEHDLIESDSCDSDFEPNHLQEKVEEFMEEETSPEINNEQWKMKIVKSFIVKQTSQVTRARPKLWKNLILETAMNAWTIVLK